jgi:gas vesicle protein
MFLLVGALIEQVYKTNFMNRKFLTLLAGVAIGILIAPARGSDTWKRIVRRLDEYQDKAADEANDILQTAKDAVKNGKTSLEEKSKELAGRALS